MEVFFFVLLFVILFSVILQLFLKNPYIVSGIIAIASLIAFAVFFDTVGLTFIIWIFIYIITSFIASLITCKFLKFKNHTDDF